MWAYVYNHLQNSCIQLKAHFLQFDEKSYFSYTIFTFIIHLLVFVLNWTNHNSEMFFSLDVVLLLQFLNRMDVLLILFY